MTTPRRAPARRDQMTAAWYDGLRAGRLLLRACPEAHLSRPDVLACDLCGSVDLGWAPSAGRGTVVARAVDHGPGASGPPTHVVVVELDEGPWLFTRAEGGLAAVGARVAVDIVRPAEGEPYPVVVPRAVGTADLV